MRFSLVRSVYMALSTLVGVGLGGAVQALEVVNETNGLVVKGRGEVSVFSPRPTEVWIVAPDDERGAVTARSGWEVGWLQAPVPALRLKTPAAREWHVVNLPHAAFEVRVGKAVVATPVLPKQSMIVLKDGTVLGGAVDADEMIPVASVDGLRFKVGTGGRWGVGVEDHAVVQGGVVAVNQRLADIEPAAGAGEPDTLEMPDGADVAEKAAPQTVNILPEEDDVNAAAEPALADGAGDVPMFGAEELPSVETPVEKHAAKVEDLPVKQVALLDARRVYVAGTLVPFTMPEGYRLVEGRVVRVPTGKRMETLVNTDMALAAAESRVESLLKPDLLDAVGHAPAVEHGAEHGEPAHEESAPAEEHHEEPVAEHGTEDAHGEPEHAAEESHGEDAAKAEEGEGHGAPAEHGEEAAGHGEEVVHGEEVSGTVDVVEIDETPTDGWLPATGRLTNYLPQVMKLQHQIARADTPQAAMAARRGLAQHYMAWRRPQEALAVASLISPSLPVDDLLTGIGLIATGNYTDANTRLQGVEGTWKDHAALWRAVAEQGEGASADALESWPAGHAAIIKQYPLWLRDVAMQSHAEAMLTVAPGPKAKQYIEEAVAARGRITPAWQRLQGLGLLSVKDRAGLEPLAAAAEQTTDGITAYQAKYDFVQALQARKELENRQMITYLEGLRYNWRGGDLEQRVLRELGGLYVAREDYRQGLERWRTLVQAYPDYPAMGALTSEMSKAVEAVFNPESKTAYEPLEYLGLYYDFRELLPDDARGDAISEQVANVLIAEGLYDRALPILDQLLNFRTQNTALDRTRLALATSNAQRLSGVPQDALRTLDKYSAEVPNTVMRENWGVAEAEALLDLDRPSEAAKALTGLNGPMAKRLRLEAMWREQNWPQVVGVADLILAGAAPTAVATDADFQVALLRQAFAYSQLQEGEKILQAQKRFADGLDKVPTMRDTMTALTGLNGVETDVEGSERPLGRFAEALNEINQVATVMENQRAAHLAEKAEQREYNEKMQYMELLPPPSL